MKKYILLIIALFCLTGCTNIDNLNYSGIVDKTLKEDSLKTNTYLEGYKLYLPLHMTLIGDLDGNEILYSYGDKYYLYVDIISYYNKKQNNYEFDSDGYEFSKDISYNDLNGYVLVSKSKGGYLVQVMYNYAKIEVISSDIKNAISRSLVVLNSISYNDSVIETLLGNSIDYNEEKFELLGPSVNTENFLEYEEEYGTYEDDGKAPDEDKIEIKPKE